MSPAATLTASRTAGLWRWAGSLGNADFCFLGRGVGTGIDTLRSTLDLRGEPAWLKQTHSAEMVEARAGCSGTADALYTRSDELALVIQTADCVPVLVAQGSLLVAIHAGWRGIESGIIGRSLRDLPAEPVRPGAVGRGRRLAAIGPAIGLCCYEVGDEVARRVAAAVGDDSVVRRHQGSKPHLDLRRAAYIQLRRAGVDIHSMAVECTRCSSNKLWSYRGQGARAGRNLAVIWPRH